MVFVIKHSKKLKCSTQFKYFHKSEKFNQKSNSKIFYDKDKKGTERFCQGNIPSNSFKETDVNDMAKI